jgi:hypothetical protein
LREYAYGFILSTWNTIMTPKPTAAAGKKPSKFVPFEKGAKDKAEPKGMKEGSKKEEAFDKKQMGQMGGGGMKATPGFKNGGKISPKRG